MTRSAEDDPTIGQAAVLGDAAELEEIGLIYDTRMQRPALPAAVAGKASPIISPMARPSLMPPFSPVSANWLYRPLMSGFGSA